MKHDSLRNAMNIIQVGYVFMFNALFIIVGCCTRHDFLFVFRVCVCISWWLHCQFVRASENLVWFGRRFIHTSSHSHSLGFSLSDSYVPNTTDQILYRSIYVSRFIEYESEREKEKEAGITSSTTTTHHTF